MYNNQRTFYAIFSGMNNFVARDGLLAAGYVDHHRSRLNAEELASELSDERVRLESELTFIRMEQQRLEDRMTEYKAQVEEVEKRSIEKDNLITDLKHELTATSTVGGGGMKLRYVEGVVSDWT